MINQYHQGGINYCEIHEQRLTVSKIIYINETRVSSVYIDWISLFCVSPQVKCHTPKEPKRAQLKRLYEVIK